MSSTKTKHKNKSHKKHTAGKSSGKLLAILCAALLFVGSLCFFSGRFYVSTFGRLGFDSVLYTLSAGLGGVQSGQITRYILLGFLPATGFTALVLWLLQCPWNRKQGKYESRTPSRAVLCWCSVLLALGMTVFAAFDVELVAYVLHQNADSGIYKAAYADPDTTKITFPEEKRNLIYIMLESMETSYLSKELGGAM